MISIDGHQDSYFLSLTREFRPGLVHCDGVCPHLFFCDGAGQPDSAVCIPARHEDRYARAGLYILNVIDFVDIPVASNLSSRHNPKSP